MGDILKRISECGVDSRMFVGMQTSKIVEPSQRNSGCSEVTPSNCLQIRVDEVAQVPTY